MMRPWYILLAIVMSALITFGLRALPFVLFRGGRSMPEWMQRLGQILPSAIMAVLIVYCLKGAKSNPIGIGIPGIIAVAVVVASYKRKHNTFISIIVGTAAYMIMLRCML
ncbi:branched-chain amino acid transporter permease [Butyrivibrio sp. YAB3001]|uniref:branched-chain amino acid transporter permease n=2 Tax=Butyrivibrio TaxID=830 RepID=UPI0008F64D64|nr:AzlD domain-containing protein [Butyrivibrio sp. YAB3001]SFC03075.1 Branched-chain amino acid transport protein AzlD [Butyrivibrio sp. YAB3001]